MTLGARLLNAVERIGNRLPDPVFLFQWLIAGLVVLSLVGAGAGWSAVNPVTGDVLQAKSLLSGENLEKLIIGMPKTLADFPPLGLVITIIYGASVAERTGAPCAPRYGGCKNGDPQEESSITATGSPLLALPIRQLMGDAH